MTEELANKLRESFESLDDRLKALEKTVNETLLGGLKAAAEEFDDDCKFSDFVDKYSDKWKGIEAPLHVLYGEDYDIPSAMFEQVKSAEGYGTEDFDEVKSLDDLIAGIEEKISALENLKDKAEDIKEEKESESDEPKAFIEEEEEIEIPSEEQLMKELREAKL